MTERARRPNPTLTLRTKITAAAYAMTDNGSTEAHIHHKLTTRFDNACRNLDLDTSDEINAAVTNAVDHHRT